MYVKVRLLGAADAPFKHFNKAIGETINKQKRELMSVELPASGGSVPSAGLLSVYTVLLILAFAIVFIRVALVGVLLNGFAGFS